MLTPDKTRVEHGLTICEKIIPWGAVWPKAWGGYQKGSPYKADKLLSDGTGKVQYITIHNTDDLSNVHDDAEQYTRATWPNANMGDVRVHYYVDDVCAWQNLREDEVGWHAGDGAQGPGNLTSLAIEIIMDGSGSAEDKKAEANGALLAAILLDRHGLGIERMVPHKYWSGKQCPLYILPHWVDFIAKVQGWLDYLKPVENPLTGAEKSSFLVRVKTPSLSYRTSQTVPAGVYTIVEERGGMGKLKSGVGWINLEGVERI